MTNYTYGECVLAQVYAVLPCMQHTHTHTIGYSCCNLLEHNRLCLYVIRPNALPLGLHLGSKPPEGMLCHLLLEWYDMAEHKVDPKQYLPAQLLQMLPYIFLVRLFCLQGHSLNPHAKQAEGLLHVFASQQPPCSAWHVLLQYMIAKTSCCSRTGQVPRIE